MSKRHRKTREFMSASTAPDTVASISFDFEESNTPRLRGKQRGKSRRNTSKPAYWD